MVNLTEFKKFFLFNLIGALIISALVAVVTVIIGKFNDITWKVLFTLLMVAVHSLVCLSFIWEDKKHDTFERLSFFTNVLFLLVVLSFITSIFGIWDILITGGTVWNLYQTYFVVGFAALHSDILSKALEKEGYLDMIIYVNYLFIFIVVSMLQPIIYLNNAHQALGDLYYRILAAAGIIDGTLGILTIIFYKLYMHKHPRVENVLGSQQVGEKPEKKGLSIWVWILIAFLVILIIFPLISLLFRFF